MALIHFSVFLGWLDSPDKTWPLDVIRVFLRGNGLLLPFIALQMYVHWLIWVAALWAVTFPGSTWSLAILFRRAWGRSN